jgi:hypothetical protein
MMKTMQMTKILSVLFLLVITSCYTEKKAQKELNKANDKYPDVVAEFTRDKYPCTELKDSTVVYDTVYQEVEALCPPQQIIYTKDTLWKKKIDTVYRKDDIYKKNPLVKTTVTVPVRQTTVTKWFEDSAKIKLLTSQINKCGEDLKQSERKKERNWDWIKWLLVALGISVIVNILFITNKK